MENVILEEKIKAFLALDDGNVYSGYGFCDGSGNGYGYGYGSGNGYGSGSGYGYGSGSGDGSGYGSGNGYGSGSGYGSGNGYGYGSGSGDGSGYGSGSGSGDGFGYGSGNGPCSNIAAVNGDTVHMIDDVPTILRSVHGNVAKGFILQGDLSLTPCFVAKGNNLFAHGNTLRDAMSALTDKLFDDMSQEQRIAEFVKAHPEKDKPYPNRDLYDWHHRLTGSCIAGRNAFIKDRGLTLEGETTVLAFIELTENAYNGSVIRALREHY